MKRKEQQSIQILTILKWIAKFIIHIIIYHLIVNLVFDYTIIYMETEKYKQLERDMEKLKNMFWWLDF